MSNEPIVHIVDDDDAVRDALSLLMLSENIPAKTYSSAVDFLDKEGHSKMGCLLLDVRMPEMDGLQLLDLLKQKNVDIPVIFITGHGDIQMAVKAIKSGASDFIEKPFDNDRLLVTVKKCLGDCYGIVEHSQHRKDIESRIAKMTKREKEVMELLVDGKQNKVIAKDLGISPRTVELHRARVMEKLNAHSLSEVVRAALLINMDS